MDIRLLLKESNPRPFVYQERALPLGSSGEPGYRVPKGFQDKFAILRNLKYDQEQPVARAQRLEARKAPNQQPHKIAE